MIYEAIDHLTLPAPVLADAGAPYERLGLRLSPGWQDDDGWLFRFLFVGNRANLFGVEFLSVADRGRAGAAAGGQRYLDAVDAKAGASVLALRVANMQDALSFLADRGVHASSRSLAGANGVADRQFVLLPQDERMIVPIALIQYANAQEECHQQFAEAGLLTHDFPLKRLDHLAAVAPDLETATRYWTDVLGVPVAGEVVSPTTIIRQFRIGDAILELLGPATLDSPLRSRPPGLISMAAFEVPDLDAAVAQARAAGFSVPDPTAGALPGTRTATIPAAALSGMAMQLLEYV